MSMHRLGMLLHGIVDVHDHADVNVTGLQLDSRRICQGDIFFALRGSRQHGISFAADAVARGASMVLAEAPAVGGLDLGVPLIWIENLHAQLGDIAARFYDNPSAAMYVIGITGTNGKTSTVQLLTQALTCLGHKAASIGTLGVGLHGQLQDAERTTPDAISIQRMLAQFRDAGATHVMMEVSSHALHQARVAGVIFQLAVFTNLTHEHLDYHGSMAAYAAVKAQLFAWPTLQTAVINVDDAFGRELLSRLPSSVAALRFSSCGDLSADLVASEIVLSTSGVDFRMLTPWGEHTLRSALLGQFNVDNLLAVTACLGALGESFDRVVLALQSLQPIRGRMQRLGGIQNKPLVVVDYAHTPAALGQVLDMLRGHCAARLICVFGCGGERDVGKRPLMGSLAERLADVVIVTDDNPRCEDGEVIVAQIVSGMTHPGRVRIERHRARAIHVALDMAAAGDVVLIAGKGHEAYQDDESGRHPFDDMAVSRAALEKMNMESDRMEPQV